MRTKLTEEIYKEYKKKTNRSWRLYQEAKELFPGGVQHNIRFFPPYPFYVTKAIDQHLYDVDGNEYVDHWMGHMVLILGHTPSPIIEALAEQVSEGTHFGLVNMKQLELGKKIRELVPCAEMVRFCCSGTEATMYASRVSRGFTRRRVVLKVEGGWHGGNPTLHKSVTSPYDQPESIGLLEDETRYTKTIRFNDIEDARRQIHENASDLAMVIVEPMMGSGAIPADASFLQSLKEETEKVGAILAFDEVITGFRLGLGGAQEFFGIKPDLCTLGKILGGGMPIGAICGRKDIMNIADPTRPTPKYERVWVGGGTFSGNPMTMTAGLAMLQTLSEGRDIIYPQINSFTQKAREAIDSIFDQYGIPTLTTGLGSLFVTHFLRKKNLTVRNPSEKVVNTDRELQQLYYISMIATHGVFFLPEHTGTFSFAHTKADLDRLLEATENFARKLKESS
ncbi:MAG: aspartate aminotransferase family protein [Candidatus Bathyarchaeia archaeon]